MKLRIQGNSIRLRLSQGEVRAFEETGKVEDRIAFGAAPGGGLAYALEQGTNDHPTAVFADHRITVYLPGQQGRQWATTDQVGIEHDMPLGNGQSLHILVEKDFKCLTERAGEDESDNFPNPNLTC